MSSTTSTLAKNMDGAVAYPAVSAGMVAGNDIDGREIRSVSLDIAGQQPGAG
jgi:hypothetical protein